MITIYQLSRQACPPCQVLKSKINTLEDKFFDYVYVDIDTLLKPGSIEEEILAQARKKGHRSLPIVGVVETFTTDTNDIIEDLKLVTSLNPSKLDDFLEFISK